MQVLLTIANKIVEIIESYFHYTLMFHLYSPYSLNEVYCTAGYGITKSFWTYG